MKIKRIRIILIIVILVILAIIYLPRVVRSSKIISNYKVSKYISKTYGDKVNNIKLIKAKNETEDIGCDGSVIWSKKIKGSYEFYYSAYSIDDDVTFYIYNNNNNGKETFKDNYYICKGVKNEAKKEIEYIRNNIKEKIISVTYEEPFSEKNYRRILSNPITYINVEIDVKLKDVIDDEYVKLINKISKELSKRNTIKSPNNQYSDINVHLNYKDGTYIDFYKDTVVCKVKLDNGGIAHNSPESYLERVRNGTY